MTSFDPLLVPARFNGPAGSGNGGWSAGALASYVDADGGPVEVTLRQPPPLDTPMEVVEDDGTWTALRDGAAVLSARRSDLVLEGVPGVSMVEARAAVDRYPGLHRHPFPTCFSCGTDREPGDGLRIFPGRVDTHDGRPRVAATWLATDDDVPVVWAALDCAGAWAADIEERMMVLGRMTAEVLRRPVVGEEHVVVGLARRSEGRKHLTATTVLDPRGEVVGRAEQVWIEVSPDAFA
ncbi:hypothetical protein I601_0685 [Nocardioides dokdonensis FR1436]|uniref:Thioesterase superfamily protein n=1 Tax=Nocardioides dokdonensis FR1436 TaxID=1300347 RepID=A0A1A9GI52_9ACTN|nr:hypothetical protein [Nocardioides dokdonensis]ANH37135.1 hypothetical protein I601_0685 [Nocardioides dokdonensis FR1436]